MCLTAHKTKILNFSFDIGGGGNNGQDPYFSPDESGGDDEGGGGSSDGGNVVQNDTYTIMQLSNAAGVSVSSAMQNATSMVQFWKNHPLNWQPISVNQAQSLVNQANIVVAGWINPNPGKSGHVVLIVPGTEVYSPRWKCNVPCAMDTGYNLRSESQKLSASFGYDKKDGILFFMYKK